jgi:hypothetical protein
MDFVIWIAVCFMIASAVSTARTKSQIARMIEGKPVELNKMIESPKPQEKHRLIRTWIVSSRDMSIPAGWRWKCACTVWGVAPDAVMGQSLGSEEAAIEGWKKHAEAYLEANRNEYKELFIQEQTDFADYRSKCYCKDANDELIQWRNK